MIVCVKLFALAKQLVGQDQIALEIPEASTVADLRQHLATQFPAVAPIASHLVFAVDAAYADDATTLTAADDVACIPPVSGG